MKVEADHWLDEAKREYIPGGRAMNVRRLLVIHFTSGASGLSSIQDWRQRASGVCAHIVIDRDGTIFQCRAFNKTCGHVGSGRWVDPHTGKRYTDINGIAIGIELANAGQDNITWAKRLSDWSTIAARHRNGGSVVQWEKFRPDQITACTNLAMTLVKRYNLDDVSGHDCLDPEDRDDPGPAFPMAAVRAACGFEGLPVVHRA